MDIIIIITTNIIILVWNQFGSCKSSWIKIKTQIQS